ncbi:hypothetical protein HD595_005834 [Nonomuraea roseoviolacea subsp. carminata]|uniref:DUF4247 domain-containing protein n=1 Tax=Nonomuraea roseoviolacea subsp. carminata TaxID=160689 RepID=A0ABT1K6R9_9ACTN|nr:hypothetical protein [Nonomuraea roseoviolacea subsp. carminata]
MVTLSVIGIVSVMIVAYCAAQDDDDVTADCVDMSQQLPDGTYEVVDEDYCDDDDDGTVHYYGGGSRGAYHWYYGGTRVGTRVRGGSSYRPSDVSISSRGGKSIQRGGFGGRSSSGS